MQALLVAELANSCVCVRLAGFTPAAVPLQQSKLARSKLIMCDADAVVAEPPEPAEEKESVLDSLSDTNAELLEKIKHMTLMEAADFIKQIDSTFNFGDEDKEEEAAEEPAAEA